ncbi:MAG: sulfotransferase domain-containing protein [Burkholderiales bacterium]
MKDFLCSTWNEAHRNKNAVLRRLQMMTSGMRALPAFIIIGAQRCWTSTLYLHLTKHPQIMGAVQKQKEVHFFDNAFDRGIDWYRSNFPLLATMRLRGLVTGKGVITGEASPYYLFHPHVARRIAEAIPNVKLIALLRNPAERAYSHYKHEVKIGLETLPFEEAIEKETVRVEPELARMLGDESYRSKTHQEFSYVSRGIYVDQLKTYDKYFRRDQMLIIKSEDYFGDVQKTYDRVLTFLGLAPHSLGGVKRREPSSRNAGIPAVETRLNAYFQPHNRRLNEYIGINFES